MSNVPPSTITVPATPEPAKQGAPAWRWLIEWVAIIAIALLGALLIRTVLFQAYYIPSASMEPTLDLHDRILVNKLAYDFHSVRRGDVVVFSRDGLKGIDEGNIKDLVKRVIGLPGDTIQSTPDGKVEVNGAILKEPYLPAGTLTFNLTKQVIPPGHYWVMGDNRGDSADSRVFGPIPKKLIVGRAFVLIWPLSRLGTL
jgi:signal peptidase I